MDWSSIGLLAFSGIFLGFGIYRIVEFDDVGLEPRPRRLLVGVHLMGCALLSSAMALLALDPQQQHKRLLSLLFGLGVFTLFPVHIYVALRRRVRYRERMGRG